jgi:hypothetical protein
VPQYHVLHPTLAKKLKFLRLVNLDYIPFQRKMVMEKLVTEAEWVMLRTYHTQCIQRIAGECSTDIGKEWVQREGFAWLQ